MSEVKTFSWQGQEVEGKVVSIYKSSTKRSKFVQLSKEPENTYDRQGHVWPTVGSIVLVD